jgi:hypothetical protein
MKTTLFRSCVFIALGTMFFSCAKDDAAVLESATNVSSQALNEAEQFAWFPTYKEVDPGKDASGSLNTPTEPRPNFPYGPDDEIPKRYPFKVIDKPDLGYVNETCLFDIADLERNKSYHKLQNGSLRIGFFDDGFEPLRLIKLPSSSESGWNAHWGTTPAVEQEKPDVLYYNTWNSRSIIIYLSKPCTEFGFEIAPNNKRSTHSFIVDVGDWLNDDSKGTVSVETKTPSGAALAAIKATKPFRMVRIWSIGSPTLPLAEGMAISNIRYTLAK